MNRRRRLLISALGILALVGPVTTRASDNPPKNAREFLDYLDGETPEERAVPPPANAIASAIVQSALVGLKKLAITLAGSSPELANLSVIRTAIGKTFIYPVEFTLCTEDSRADCDDGSAYAFKNYPREKVVLVDIRDLPGRWETLTLEKRQSLSVHEFAGIAGIEIENHALSAQVDVSDVLDTLQSKDDFRRYFQLMNDYFFLLPGVPSDDFRGLWIKRAALFPTKLKVAQRDSRPVTAEKYMIAIADWNPGMVSLSYPNPRDYGIKTGLDFKYDLDVTRANSPILATAANGGIEARSNVEFKRRGALAKRYASEFEADSEKNFPQFECKLIEEDRMICRDIYARKQSLGLTEIFVRDSEYAIYDRFTPPK